MVALSSLKEPEEKPSRTHVQRTGGRVSGEKRFPQPLVLDLSVSTPGKLRPLCPTSLSVSHHRDPSLNSPAGLEGF